MSRTRIWKHEDGREATIKVLSLAMAACIADGIVERAGDFYPGTDIKTGIDQGQLAEPAFI